MKASVLTSLTLLGTLFGGCATQTGNPDSLRRAFESAKPGDTLVIPPGEYALDGKVPIPLKSDLTIIAEGAAFRLPEQMGDKARAVVFQGGNGKRGHVLTLDKRRKLWRFCKSWRAR